MQWAFEAYATGEHTIRTWPKRWPPAASPPTGAQAGAARSPNSYVATILINRYYLGYVTFKGIDTRASTSPSSRRPYSTRSSLHLDALVLQPPSDVGQGSDPIRHQSGDPTVRVIGFRLALTHPCHHLHHRREVGRLPAHDLDPVPADGALQHGRAVVGDRATVVDHGDPDRRLPR